PEHEPALLQLHYSLVRQPFPPKPEFQEVPAASMYCRPPESLQECKPCMWYLLCKTRLSNLAQNLEHITSKSCRSAPLGEGGKAEKRWQ
ncbi:Hypothetical predicted protein, partial [Pelobates cultripes]